MITSDFISEQDSGLIRRRRLRFRLETLIELNCFLSRSLRPAPAQFTVQQFARQPLSFSISLPNGFRGRRGKTMPIDRSDNPPFRRTTAPARPFESLASARLTNDRGTPREKQTTRPKHRVKRESGEESRGTGEPEAKQGNEVQTTGCDE